MLSRISRVEFPSASGVCTKTRIELKLERAEGERTTDICALRPNAPDERFETGADGDTSDSARIIAAQDFLLRNSLTGGGKLVFCEAGFVSVRVRAPDVPDLTLVDLPGVFSAHSKDQEDPKRRVDAFVHKEIAEETSFVLHVLQIDKDLGQVGTWLEIEKAKAQDRSMIVFTHADKVNAPEEVTQRVDYAIERGTPPGRIFVVNARAKSTEEEADDLETRLQAPTLDGLRERGVLIGCSALRHNAGQVVRGHLHKHLSALPGVLAREARSRQAELAELGAEPYGPAEALQRTLMDLLHRAQPREKTPVFSPLSNLIDELGADLVRLGLVCVSGDDEVKEVSACATIARGAGLQDGQIVKLIEHGFITQAKLKKLTRVDLHGAGVGSSAEQDKILTSLRCAGGRENDDVSDAGAPDGTVSDVTVVCVLFDALAAVHETRFGRTAGLTDPMPLAELHARSFAERARPVLDAFHAAFAEIVLEQLFRPVFDTSAASGDRRALPACTGAVAALRAEFESGFVALRERVSQHIDDTLERMSRAGSNPSLFPIFTSNTHYARDTETVMLKRLLQRADVIGTDAAAAASKLAAAYGFVKTQQKRVADDVQNFICLQLLDRASEALVGLIKNASARTDLLKFVREDAATQRRREDLKKQLAVIAKMDERLAALEKGEK